MQHRVGGLNHLEFEMLKMSVKQKLDIEHVPYQGVNPALTALLGDQVQVCTLPYSSLVKKMTASNSASSRSRDPSACLPPGRAYDG